MSPSEHSELSGELSEHSGEDSRDQALRAEPPARPNAAPRASPLPAPTRLEMAREIEALRLSVRERESWLDELRRELEERDASYGWKDQEARTAVAEAAAARRETAQYQEDRDHVRKQLHAKTDELTLAEAKATKLEAEVADLRLERRKRKEEMVELRARLEGHETDQAQQAQGSEAPHAENDAAAARLAELEAELAEVQGMLLQTRDTMTGLADELAASQDEAQTQSTTANATRSHNIDLLQRVALQGEELAALRAELDQLKTTFADERRAAQTRLAALSAELDAALVAGDKSPELLELAAAHEELAALRGPMGTAPQPDLASRDARLAALEQELAERSAQLTRLSQELQELRDRGFARYLESP